MNKTYMEIDFGFGLTLEECVNILLEYKAKGSLVYGKFNIFKFYSDKVTMDNAYIEVHGVTKAEFDKERKKFREELQMEKLNYINTIPMLSEYWSKKGREVLDENKYELRNEMVQFSLEGLHKGNELKECLDIIEMLNNSRTLEDVKELVSKKERYGMSTKLVYSMVKELCPRGQEFISSIM